MALAMVTAAVAMNHILPVPQPLVLDYNLMAWLQLHGKQASAVNCIIWACYCLVGIWGGTMPARNDAGAASPRAEVLHGNPAANLPVEFDYPLPGAGGVAMVPVPADLSDPNITKAQLSFAQSLRVNVLRFLVEMVAAHQIRPLKARNINGLLATYKIDGTASDMGNSILDHLPYFSSMLPRIVGDVNFTNTINGIAWLRYHTNAASTPALVEKFHSDLAGINFLSANTVTAVNNAIASPWDGNLVNAIPIAAVGACAVYLNVSKQYPPNRWYQGEKALASMSAVTKEQLKAFFTKWIELSSDNAAAAGAATIAALTGLYPQFNGNHY